MATSHSKPRNRALELLRAALDTGIRGANREAVQTAIDVLEDDGKSDLRDMNYRNLRTGKTLNDPKRPGLRMRSNKSGKVWLYRFQHPTTKKYVEQQLGTYPEVSLQQVRKQWEGLREQRLQGKVPSMVEEGDTGSSGLTMAVLCDRYIEGYAKAVKRSWRDDARLLDREVLPDYGAMPVEQFDSSVVSAVLLKIKERGAGREAEKVRAVLSTLFNVARGRTRKVDFLGGTWLPRGFSNPVEGVQLAERKSKSAVLKLGELRSFLLNLHHLRDDYAQLLRFQLETCSRLGDVCGMTWAEVDWVESVWTLPADRAKNGMEHRVMLSKQSMELLESRHQWRGGCTHIFPAQRNIKRPLRVDLVGEVIAKNRETLGIPDNATSHSLRHTCLTELASMNVPREVRDRISNHKPPSTDMDARYNRHEYDEEAREALQRWADKLCELAVDNLMIIGGNYDE